MAQQLAYVIVTPYTLAKSRTGEILARHRPLDFPRRNAGGQFPSNLRGEADIAAVAPVGVPARGHREAQAGQDGFAGLCGSLVQQQLDLGGSTLGAGRGKAEQTEEE